VVEELPGFVFTTKVPKELTHDEKIEPAALSGGAALLLESLKPLVEAGRLGAVLLQFPFYFRDFPGHRDRIRRLVEAFRPLPAVVEVRHPGFFFGPLREGKRPGEEEGEEPAQPVPAAPEERPLSTGPGSAIRFFEEIGAGFVNVDLPPSRATPPPTAINTSATGYVRLHGRNRKTWFNPKAGRDQKYDYHYSRNELAEWAERVRRLGERTERTFVILNNHFRGQAPANALLLLRLLGRSTAPPPPELVAAFPELREALGSAS